MLYRQGDVFVDVTPIPAGALPRGGVVLADGELTGHQHRIEDPASASILTFRGQTYLRVTAEAARLVHDEHETIVLPRGDYRFWRQREYAARPADLERVERRSPRGLTQRDWRFVAD